MKTKLIASALVLLTAGIVIAYPSIKSSATDLATPNTVPTRPVTRAQQVEVVFVLDTTSSMSGLIEAAKQKIWSIATTLAQAEQAPSIRMGLVAFRDRGDAYVTEVVDLSTNLDAMYQRLMQFAAVGGGDGPESVNQALADAVHRISWSRDQSSYRVVFLVGDAPPHMDYQGEAQYPEIVREAVARGIIVNTIQCGNVRQTTAPWQRIAALGNGRYLQVGQSGDVFAVATPYDDEIAVLAGTLEETRLSYGDGDEMAMAREAERNRVSMLAGMGTAEQAQRGIFSATAAGSDSQFSEGDLVAAVTSGEVSLEAVEPEHLPESLRELDAAAQQARIVELAEERRSLRTRIESLRKLRSAYIEEQVAEEGADHALERQLYDVVREQAAPLGLTYEEGPEY